MFPLIRTVCPSAREPNLERWGNSIRLLRERDSRTHNQIRALFTWANQHDFWAANILSPDKLRAKWDTLTAQRRRDGAFQLAENEKS